MPCCCVRCAPACVHMHMCCPALTVHACIDTHVHGHTGVRWETTPGTNSIWKMASCITPGNPTLTNTKHKWGRCHFLLYHPWTVCIDYYTSVTHSAPYKYATSKLHIRAKNFATPPQRITMPILIFIASSNNMHSHTLFSWVTSH